MGTTAVTSGAESAPDGGEGADGGYEHRSKRQS
jgi:hypothetical protein